MFEKNMKLAYLLDFYGEILDEHTRTILQAYYEDDLSLAEIAADEGISRQGIRHVVKKGEDQLLFWESKLGLAEHYTALKKTAERLDEVERLLKSRTSPEDICAHKIVSEAIQLLLSKGV